MNFSKTAQITPIEISILVLLVMSSLVFVKFVDNYEPSNWDLTIESYMDSIYYSNDFRSLILQENLSSSTFSEDWSSLLGNLSNSFSNYSLGISNITNSKEILDNCGSEYIEYYYTQRIVAVQNSSSYEFRVLTLGVCY